MCWVAVAAVAVPGNRSIVAPRDGRLRDSAAKVRPAPTTPRSSDGRSAEKAPINRS